MTTYYDEPPVNDEILTCPDCEQPTQFGEVCPRCEQEYQRALQDAQNGDEKASRFIRLCNAGRGIA